MSDVILITGKLTAMMGYVLSFLPRRWLQAALAEQWRATLTYGEAIRFDHWGATGNKAHHEFAWADELPTPSTAKEA